jgi:hypothetical protein
VRLHTFENTFVVLKRSESSERLELGPDTQVFIDKWEMDKQLYFDRGELFLSASGERGTYRVDTADFELVTSNADYSLRTEKNGTRVEVSGGELSVVRRRDGAQIKLEKDDWMYLVKRASLVKRQNPFQMITPMPNDHMHLVTGESKVPTRFAWTGVPANYAVELFVGMNDQDLKRTDFEERTKAAEGIYSFDEGVRFWKLVFKEPQKRGKRGREIATPVYRILVLRESPVQIKSPRTKVSPNHIMAFGGVKFSWSNPSRLEKLMLEVAFDKNFDRTVLRQQVEDVGEQVLQLSGEGIYFWRVNGFRRGSSEFISSEAASFEITTKEQPPEIISPSPSDVFTVRSLKEQRAALIWKTDSVGPVRVQIFAKGNKQTTEDKPVIEATLNSGEPWALPELQAGRYLLSLGSTLGSAGAKGSTVDFEVVQAESLRWNLPQDQVPVSVDEVKWDKGPKNTVSYKLKLWPVFSRSSGVELKTMILKDPSWSYRGPSDNLLLLTVQALDHDGEIVAETPELLFQPRQERP